MALQLLPAVLVSLALPLSDARWQALFAQSPETSAMAKSGAAVNQTAGMATVQQQDAMIKQIEHAWTTGFWTSFAVSGLKLPDGCGGSTFTELSMPIPQWRRMHPHRNAFCHFTNLAMWFQGVQHSSQDYKAAGRFGWTVSSTSSPMCNYLGAGRGPERSITYDAGTITWNHLDHCVDLIDDPYCFSNGWLKNQHTKDHLMSNSTAWDEFGKAECARIQEEFQFLDEEVTVGKHIFSTPVYFKGAWCALYGGCPPVTVRTHKEHVYTKCLLGDTAAAEMAYCYYKGCVLPPGNRIGHGRECGYDNLFPQ